MFSDERTTINGIDAVIKDPGLRDPNHAPAQSGQVRFTRQGKRYAAAESLASGHDRCTQLVVFGIPCGDVILDLSHAEERTINFLKGL